LVELEKQTGKLCREIFSMVAGTSTGSIIAACVAAGIPATNILSFYQADAPKIFDLSSLESLPVRVARGYAYQSDKVEVALKSKLGAAAEWCLNDSPIRLLICSTKVDGRAMYFVQDRPKNSGTTGKLLLVDCAVASAAAPTYLSPWYVAPMGGSLVGWCVDGGVSGMANPTYQACVEAFLYDDFDPTNTSVISLGTGYSPNSAVNPPSGIVATLSLVLDSLLSNAGVQQDNAAKRSFPGVVQRFNWKLPKAVDMADASAIPSLVKLGQELAPQMNWRAVLEL
jgi:patatin-like phospholipase/acyl hydrolase